MFPRFVEIPISAQQWFSEFVISKSAACSLDVSVTVNNAPNTFGGYCVGIILHFYEDEPPVAAIGFIHVQNSMGSCARASKGVNDNRIFIFC